jgi:hypothetical protein
MNVDQPQSDGRLRRRFSATLAGAAAVTTAERDGSGRERGLFPTVCAGSNAERRGRSIDGAVELGARCMYQDGKFDDAAFGKATEPGRASQTWGELERAAITPALLGKVQDRIGRAIRRRRRLMELTLQQVGDRCSISFQQVQKYEAGVNTISAAQLWALAQALEVPVSYFYEGIGPF